MLALKDLWAGIALPMALTAATLAISWHATRRRLDARGSRSWAGPLALGIGFAGGYWTLFGWSGFPPPDATEWVFFLTLPLAVIGAFESRWLPPLQVRLALGALAAAMLVLLVGWPVLYAEGKIQGDMALRLAIVGTLAVGWIVSMDTLAVRVSAGRASAILLAAVVPASVGLALSGSQRLGQAAGVLAATQGGALVVNRLLGRAGTGRHAVLIFGILYAGLLLCGNLYADLTAANGLLLFAAPNFAWLAQDSNARHSSWARATAQIGLVTAISGWAIVRIWLDSVPAVAG
jgi:hypothetical protein